MYVNNVLWTICRIVMCNIWVLQIFCCHDDVSHFCAIQGVADAFEGVAAPLTLVLTVDVLTTTIYLAIGVFNGKWTVAFIFLSIAIIIMILWAFCAACYNLCKAKMCKTKFKRMLVNILIGVGGCFYLIGDNLPPIIQLQSNSTAILCKQSVEDLHKESPTYGKVLIGISVFLFSMIPTCIFKFNTLEEIKESIIEKEQNFPVTFTLTSLAVIVEINAWYSIIVTNPTQECPLAEMIADFIIYGLFVIGWFIIITIFLISDCRKANERKRKKIVKLYVIFTMIVLVPSLPIYLLADNDRPLSCVPGLKRNDLGCHGHGVVRFGMLLALSAFLTPLTAFTACCQLYLMCKYKKKQKNWNNSTVCDADIDSGRNIDNICVAMLWLNLFIPHSS